MVKALLWVTSKLHTDYFLRLLAGRVSHIALDYEKARTEIERADWDAASIKRKVTADFEKRKKLTLDATEKAVEKMFNDTAREFMQNEARYLNVKQKIEAKRDAASRVYDIVSKLGKDEFPLF